MTLGNSIWLPFPESFPKDLFPTSPLFGKENTISQNTECSKGSPLPSCSQPGQQLPCMADGYSGVTIFNYCCIFSNKKKSLSEKQTKQKQLITNPFHILKTK